MPWIIFKRLKINIFPKFSLFSYHFDKHEEQPKVLAAVFDVIGDSGKERDNVLDDDGDSLNVVRGVLQLAGETFLHQLGEVDPDVPGVGLHQVRLDVLETLLRGQEVHQPLGGRGTERDQVVDGVDPVNHTRSTSKMLE